MAKFTGETADLSSRPYWKWCVIVVCLWSGILVLSLVDVFSENQKQISYVHTQVRAHQTGGDVIPLDDYDALADGAFRHLALTHFLAWILGCGGAIIMTLRFTNQARTRAAIERTRREDAAEFRTTMEASTAGLYRIKNLHFDYVNPAMARMLGYQVEELIGLTPMEIVAPHERERVRNNTIRRAGGEPGVPYEVMCQRKDGSLFHAITWSNRITYNGAFSTVGSLVDISERIRAEEDLRKAMDALAASNTELEHFAYVASHDLQEPLRSITSFAQLLERRLDNGLDQETREYLSFVIAGAKRMHTLVNDLLAYSRVGSKAVTLVPVESALAVESARLALRESIEEAKGEIVIAPLPVVRGCFQQLTQLFQNLLGNALKFRRPGVPPRIHVQARLDAGWAVFSVSDNGIGMAAEHFDQIFSMFRRLHTSETYPGTGIGLAICKRIVECHGGKIWVESTEGQGSTFLFSLPLSQENSVQTEQVQA